MAKKTLRVDFFQRIGKYIVLFALLGIVATFLTILTVSLGTYFGDNIAIGSFFFNFNVFFTYMIGFIVTPIVILYVSKKREEVVKKNNTKNHSSTASTRRNGSR